MAGDTSNSATEWLERSPVHLLHRVEQAVSEAFQSELGDVDLTERQLAVLHAIAAAEVPSQTDVVETTGIDRSTLADLVRRLFKRRLIERRRSKKDARAYELKLSDAGQDLLRRARPFGDAVDARILESLPASRRIAFLRNLELIAGASGKAKP